MLRNEHVTLHREQVVKQEKLRELDARLRDVQMLKFGQVIDLERIESVGVNKPAEELRERIKKIEATQQQALQTWHGKLRGTKLDIRPYVLLGAIFRTSALASGAVVLQMARRSGIA